MKSKLPLPIPPYKFPFSPVSAGLEYSDYKNEKKDWLRCLKEQSNSHCACSSKRSGSSGKTIVSSQEKAGTPFTLRASAMSSFICFCTPSSSSLNLRLMEQVAGEEGERNERCTQAPWSCCQTREYLSLISQTCLNIILLFQMSTRSSFRILLISSQGTLPSSWFLERKSKNQIMSARKLFGLMFFWCCLSNSSQTVDSLKKLQSLPIRSLPLGRQAMNFQTSASSQPESLRMSLKQICNSFSLRIRHRMVFTRYSICGLDYSSCP